MNKKIFIFSVILLVGFIVISSSAAADINEDILSVGNSEGVSVEVDNEADLIAAINNDSIDEIKIKNDIELSKSIEIPENHSNLKIDGQNNKIYAADNFTTGGDDCAFYWAAIEGRLFNCIFTGFNNPALVNGGVVFWVGFDGWIENCSFIGNNVSRWGGAICWFGDEGIIFNCNFENNTATLGGNSISVSAKNLTIAYCNFSHAIPEGCQNEIYLSSDSKNIAIVFNTFLTQPFELFYESLEIAAGEQFGDWATVRLAENKFGNNCIVNNGKITSPIKMVFDSKVVKKGEKAVITGTIYDDNGNYIVTDADIFAYLDGDRSKGYKADPCDLFYYFYIPTKDLKAGVHKLSASIVEENDDVTFEGTLTVVDNSTNHNDGIPMEHAGNPLVVLLIALATIGIGSLKRKL